MSDQLLTFEGIMEFMRRSSRRSDREFRKMRREMKEREAKYEREKAESAAAFDRRMAESAAAFDLRMQKTELQIERTSREVGKLGNSIGRVIEHMIGERIIEKFQALGYGVTHPVRRNCSFMSSKMGIYGEFDLSLVDTDTIILIEVKTTLETRDVRKHLEKIAEYRRHIDAVGFSQPPFTHMLPSTRFFGAVAGAVVEDDAIKFAHENGLYTIVQSGDAVEIMPTPEGFQAKQW